MACLVLTVWLLMHLRQSNLLRGVGVGKAPIIVVGAKAHDLVMVLETLLLLLVLPAAAVGVWRGRQGKALALPGNAGAAR